MQWEGDNAPQALVEGVNQAIRDLLILRLCVWREAKSKDYLTATELVSIVLEEKSIQMMSQRGLRRKKQASMVLAQGCSWWGRCLMLSAGNTGALLAAGFFIVGQIKGVERPGWCPTLPAVNGRGYDMPELGVPMRKIHQSTCINMLWWWGPIILKMFEDSKTTRRSIEQWDRSLNGRILCARKPTGIIWDESIHLLEMWKARDLMDKRC